MRTELDQAIIDYHLNLCRGYYKELKAKFPHLPAFRPGLVVIANKKCRASLSGRHIAHCHNEKPFKICLNPKYLLRPVAYHKESHDNLTHVDTENELVAWHGEWVILENETFLKHLMAHETAHIRTKGRHTSQFWEKYQRYVSIF